MPQHDLASADRHGASTANRQERRLSATPSAAPGDGPLYFAPHPAHSNLASADTCTRVVSAWQASHTGGSNLRFLAAHQRSAAKRTAVDDLQRYLATNRERMRYGSFRARGYHIGSGAVEGAVNHVVQQRMKARSWQRRTAA